LSISPRGTAGTPSNANSRPPCKADADSEAGIKASTSTARGGDDLCNSEAGGNEDDDNDEEEETADEEADAVVAADEKGKEDKRWSRRRAIATRFREEAAPWFRAQKRSWISSVLIAIAFLTAVQTCEDATKIGQQPGESRAERGGHRQQRAESRRRKQKK
jgi:hypothetical protein